MNKLNDIKNLELVESVLKQEKKDISKFKTEMIRDNWVPWWDRDPTGKRYLETDYKTVCKYSNEVNKAAMQVMKVLYWKQEKIEDKDILETINEHLEKSKENELKITEYLNNYPHKFIRNQR